MDCLLSRLLSGIEIQNLKRWWHYFARRVTLFWLGCGNTIRLHILARSAHVVLGDVMRDVTDCVGRALFGARLPEQTPQEREVANQLLRDQCIDRRCSERGCPRRHIRKNATLHTSCFGTKADAYMVV